MCRRFVDSLPRAGRSTRAKATGRSNDSCREASGCVFVSKKIEVVFEVE